MLKRGMVLFLMTCMLCGAALGEALPSGGLRPDQWGEPAATAVPPFTFRGGVTWGMSREQVKGLEPVQLTERSQGNWSILYPASPVEVSRYQADLVYMFYEDALKMITYDFGSGGGSADYAYLTGALDSVYGDHTEPDPGIVVGVMDQIYPGYYTTERLSSVRGWAAGEDTRVYLYYYGENAYGILYVMSGSGFPAPGGYVTTGL